MASAYQRERAVATDAARAAGELLLQHFTRGVETEYKGERDVVSAADRESEDLIRAHIGEAFPDDIVVGEEGEQADETHVGGKRRWYVDPLDGTANFLKQRERWCVSIGFCDVDDEMAAGVVFSPVSGQMFAAARGAGATHNDQPITASSVDRLNGSLVATGFPRDDPQANAGPLVAVFSRTLSVRAMGCAAMDLCDVAWGRLDAYWTLTTGRWDIAAGIVVTTEAGAILTDVEGRPVTGPAEQVVAAAPGIHAELLPLLRGGG